jgi:hypothetical protein
MYSNALHVGVALCECSARLDKEMKNAVATGDIGQKPLFSEDENPGIAALVDSFKCQDSGEGI